MRIAGGGHSVFSITMIGLGIVGLLNRDFVPVWNPVPASIPGREVFLCLGSVISLASGIGLLIPRLAVVAARLLLTTLLLWLLLFRLPNFLLTPLFKRAGPCFRSRSCWLPPGCYMSGSPLTWNVNTLALSTATPACVSRMYSTASR